MRYCMEIEENSLPFVEDWVNPWRKRIIGFGTSYIKYYLSWKSMDSHY